MSSAFIIGCGRSGTTLVGTILNAHPAIDVPGPEGLFAIYGNYVPVPGGDGELSDLHWAKLLNLLVTDVGIRSWKFPPTLSDLNIDVVRRDFSTAYRLLYEHHAKKSGKEMWISIAIANVLSLDRIHRDFPDAKYIYCLRDGRDVVVSLLESAFGPTNLHDAARYWVRHVDAMQQAELFIPSTQIFTLRYEHLITQFEGTVRKLFDFLRVPFHADCLNYFMTADAVSRGSVAEHSNLLKPPDNSRIGRSRTVLSRKEIGWIENVSRSQLARSGYTLTWDDPPTIPAYHIWLGNFMHPVKLLWKMLSTKNKRVRAAFFQRNFRKLRYTIWPGE